MSRDELLEAVKVLVYGDDEAHWIDRNVEQCWDAFSYAQQNLDRALERRAELDTRAQRAEELIRSVVDA